MPADYQRPPSRADPVLASALENAFTEALSNAESNALYKTVLHRRRMLTLWVIIIDNVTDGQVNGEDVWNAKVVQERARQLMYVLACDLRGCDGESPIKASTLRDLFTDFIYCIVKYTRDKMATRCNLALLTRTTIAVPLILAELVPVLSLCLYAAHSWAVVDEFELERGSGDKIMYAKDAHRRSARKHRKQWSGPRHPELSLHGTLLGSRTARSKRMTIRKKQRTDGRTEDSVKSGSALFWSTCFPSTLGYHALSCLFRFRASPKAESEREGLKGRLDEELGPSEPKPSKLKPEICQPLEI
ncbi:hypothetical protein EDD85DRAFT_794813 [Armillaria nabsnona]|nr:hypothetical protein EDD85DRAFT_794813 [Armillaria nabsnona]